ncbi:MAG: AgmX/PglI C-terminal domain-containing protein [Polyangiaceae bacterium]|nr:AgmX/PglI C-terminal domain-containing protein [Polyangiaceae bacterium]
MRSALFALALITLGACGGNEPVAKTPQQKHEDPEPEPGKGLDVSAEIGALDETKVDKAFQASVKGLTRCLADGAKRVELLGGQVAFFVKIDQRGSVAHAHLEKSTLGDRKTEKCMLEALGRQAWPAPVGGLVGIAKKGFDFDPPNDVRPPTEWDSDRAEGALGSRKGELQRCKAGKSGSFQATLYVNTNGSVMAAGVTPPDESGEAAVDCLVGVVEGTKFPSPGSWPAKVSVEL